MAGVALHGVQQTALMVRKRADCQLARCCAAAAARAGARISTMYPVVELVTALVFAGGVAVYGLSPLLVVRLAFASRAGRALCDRPGASNPAERDHAAGHRRRTGGELVSAAGWLSSLIGAAAGGGILLAIAEAYYRVRGQEGLGMGDVKMLAMIGAFLGWPSDDADAGAGVVCGLDGRRRSHRRRGAAACRPRFRSARFSPSAPWLPRLPVSRMLAWYLSFY